MKLRRSCNRRDVKYFISLSLYFFPRDREEGIAKRGYRHKVVRIVPMLTDRHKEQRVLWARNNKETDWERVVFSDEMSIWLAGGKIQLWCKGSQEAVKPRNKHSPKLHVWGAFSARGTFPLKVFRENLFGEVYTNILKECLVTQAETLYPNGWIFQEDNDPKHTSKVAKIFREVNGIVRMEWPAFSPDLNPIENLGLDQTSSGFEPSI